MPRRVNSGLSDAADFSLYAYGGTDGCVQLALALCAPVRSPGLAACTVLRTDGWWTCGRLEGVAGWRHCHVLTTRLTR